MKVHPVDMFMVSIGILEYALGEWSLRPHRRVIGVVTSLVFPKIRDGPPCQAMGSRREKLKLLKVKRLLRTVWIWTIVTLQRTRTNVLQAERWRFQFTLLVLGWRR